MSVQKDVTSPSASPSLRNKMMVMSAATMAFVLLCTMPTFAGAYSLHRSQRLFAMDTSGKRLSRLNRSTSSKRRPSVAYGSAFAPMDIAASNCRLRMATIDNDYGEGEYEEAEQEDEEEVEDEYEEEYEDSVITEDENDDEDIDAGLSQVHESADEYIEDEYFPIEDDPDDPNYNAQRTMLDENLPRLQAIASYKKMVRDQIDTTGMTEDWKKSLDNFFEEQLTEEQLAEAEKKAKEFEISDDDIEALSDESIDQAESEMESLQGEDTFPSDGPLLESKGFTNEMLVSIDNAAKEYFKRKESSQEETFEGKSSFDSINEEEGLAKLNVTDAEQYGELLLVLKEMKEDERPTYKAEKLLLYDLQFNMTKIFLAACKHNPEAPIILPQWLFQMEVYDKYAEGQDRKFEYTWEEANAVDMSELENYWRGLGYDAIPTRTERETNIITIEPPDEDEIQMSHLQEWMKEVYNPEFDQVFFDDDSFMPYDSVFADEFYEKDLPKDQVELEAMTQEIKDVVEAGEGSEEDQQELLQYMDGLVSIKNYTEGVQHDSTEAAEFQGHLVVACSADDKDLAVAEKISERFGNEFGRRIFVETRVYGHAKPEDFLFEIWLESYDIDLLHSKRKATLSSSTWDGPQICNDEQIDYLVDEVEYLISDEHRYSYRIFEYEGIEEG